MGIDRTTRLGEYAERWFELKRRNPKPKSIGNYSSLINVHLAKYAGQRLNDVTASAVQRMIANMRNLDGTPCSYDRQLGFYNILNQIFNAAVADRLIPTSPVTSAARPKRRDTGLAGGRRTINGPAVVSTDKRSGTQDRKAFTVKQMQDMLEESSDDLFLGSRQWWRLFTGMRQGEILGAPLDDLDPWRDKALETPSWAPSCTGIWRPRTASSRTRTTWYSGRARVCRWPRWMTGPVFATSCAGRASPTTRTGTGMNAATP